MKIRGFDKIDIEEVTCDQNCFFSLHLTNL